MGKQENLIYLTAKENISLNGGKVFINAGKRAGLSKKDVEKILESRKLKKLVELEK